MSSKKKKEKQKLKITRLRTLILLFNLNQLKSLKLLFDQVRVCNACENWYSQVLSANSDPDVCKKIIESCWKTFR